MKAQEFEKELLGLGYQFWLFSITTDGRYTLYGLTREVNDFLDGVPFAERIYKAFDGAPTKITFRASVSVREGPTGITEVSYHYGYDVEGGEGLWLGKVRLIGDLDALYPHGRPTSCVIDWSSLYVGPIPKGKGQKKRATAAILAALQTPFAREFPEATIYARLETRGGLGGWKAKMAHHDMGTIAEWLSKGL